ncbi:MAG: BamA/TamA family outer membrane protein [Sediminibacterium sp.]
MRNLLMAVAALIPFFIQAQEASGIIIPTKPVTKRDTLGQKDLIDIAKRLFNFRSGKPIREERGKNVYFSFLPFNSSVPGGSGRALITTTTAAAYFGPRKTTNISSATFTPYWNFNNRFGLPLRTSIWLANNTWTIQGDSRFLYYPQFSWGLGGVRTENEKLLVDYKYIRFYQSALKKITPYFLAGGGYYLDHHLNIKTDDTAKNLKQYTGYDYGTGSNSLSSGISVNLLYDTRNNSINPLPGMYANLVYRINTKVLGSNDNWQSLFIDIRKYISLNKTNRQQQNTLAFWTYLWTVFNNPAPLLDLPGIGWDPDNRSGRGIDQNRYSGKSLLYFESEYRYRITENGLLGGVAFVNLQNFSSDLSPQYSKLFPGYGLGLRLKLNKNSGANLCVDYGFGQNGSRGFFVNLGEVF